MHVERDGMYGVSEYGDIISRTFFTNRAWHELLAFGHTGVFVTEYGELDSIEQHIESLDLSSEDEALMRDGIAMAMADPEYKARALG